MTLKQHKLIAYLAIIAIWLIWLSDLAIDIRTMFDDGFWQPMANLQPWRITFATFALFLFPLVSGGVYVLNKGLKKPLLSLLLFVIFSTVCIYMHSSYFFFAKASSYYADTSGAEQAVIAGLLQEYNAFKNTFGAIFLISVLIASAWLLVVVAANKTVFPRYFALLNPLTGTVLGKSIHALYPPLATMIYPVIIPAFWMALLFTVYLLYLLKRPYLLD